MRLEDANLDGLKGMPDVKYDFTVSADLQAAFRTAASTLEGQRGTRSTLRSNALTDFWGYYSTLFESNGTTQLDDLDEIVTNLRLVADRVSEVDTAARAENNRRRQPGQAVGGAAGQSRYPRPSRGGVRFRGRGASLRGDRREVHGSVQDADGRGAVGAHRAGGHGRGRDDVVGQAGESAGLRHGLARRRRAAGGDAGDAARPLLVLRDLLLVGDPGRLQRDQRIRVLAGGQ
jgi:hypothetical protein